MKLNLETASLSEVEVVVKECKKMVTKRALASAGAGAIPVPGVDIVADVSMLLELIPSITRKFGLEEEDLGGLPNEIKIIVAKVLADYAADFLGKAVVKDLILNVLKRFGVRVASKQVVKYIPILGQGAAAILSFTLMKVVGNSHVYDCEKAVIKTINERDSKK
jgi:uncharacterized protein (DUF697 family)